MRRRRRWAVLAVAATPLLLAPASNARTIQFAGRDWTVKTSAGRVGPGPNYFSDSSGNVWVDASGKLHLRITRRGGRWYCAEIVGSGSLGYGSYRWDLESDLAQLDPNVVLGLFTWSNAPAENHRELDIELSRWSSATNLPGQYVVQPCTDARNIYRFDWPRGLVLSTQSFSWTPGRVDFASSTQGALLRSWSGTNLVPGAGDERPRLNLWLFRGRKPSDGREVEVVVSAFTFAPAP